MKLLLKAFNKLTGKCPTSPKPEKVWQIYDVATPSGIRRESLFLLFLIFESRVAASPCSLVYYFPLQPVSPSRIPALQPACHVTPTPSDYVLLSGEAVRCLVFGARDGRADSELGNWTCLLHGLWISLGTRFTRHLAVSRYRLYI